MARPGSFAGKVMEAARDLAEKQEAGEFDRADVRHWLLEVGGLGYHPKPVSKRVGVAVRDLVKTGELEQLGDDRYSLARRKPQPNIRDKMWQALRMRRTATLEDLCMISGADAKYVRQVMRTLIRRKIVAAVGDSAWRLMVDQVETPEDDEKKEYLRGYRDALKQARDALEGLLP